LATFCLENGIRRLAVFGSALHANATPQSDLDLLVEFLPGRTPGLLAMARLERQLSPLFDGCRVDLRTPEDLSRHFRQEVVDEAEDLFPPGRPKSAPTGSEGR
jgi:hypothetical protein